MRPASLLVFTVALLSPMADASPVTFQASGSFQDGSTLGGTIVIDTTVGSVISGDLTITGLADFTTLAAQNTWPPGSPFLYEANFGNGQLTDNYLTFLFPPDSLVGYSGGILCGIGDLCKNATNQFFSNFATLSGGLIDASTFVDLERGSLIATTPEPSMPAFFLVTLALVALGIRRVRAKNVAR